MPTYIIDDLQLNACDLIQIDTEGYESKILHGAKNTLSKYKPLVSIEDSSEEIKNYLDLFGYKKIAEVYRDTIYKCE